MHRDPRASYTTKTVAEWVAHWNSKADITDPIALNGYCINGTPISEALYRRAVIEPYLDRLELQSHHEVLEVGCGSGLILSELERRVKRVAGTDISQVMLARYAGSAELHCCEADALPFSPATFDRILMAGVALYFPDFAYFERVVRKLVDILRLDGIVLIGDMTSAPSRQFSTFDRRAIVELLEGLGHPFSLMAQSREKRRINRRYDIIIYKDAA